MMTEETLFDLLLRTPDAERGALLDRACEGKPQLRARVEALLKADAVPDKYLEQAAAFDATTGFEMTGSFAGGDVPGIVIAGRYKLLEAIGEGGMGTVWMAQQSEPVKRLVAIKLIKAGMDSKAVQARFDAERQALAMMDHPNIAKVLDGGLTEDRRPYFVMELVKGTPITKFCDERKLSLKERLELFVPVCQAIQHAHQKGIIHRDIKPSNVLIALYDDKPVPKVIDFGVAKAAGAQLTELTLNTGFGAIVGTPEYMSPEQASLNNLDIDTRSDVYALGVLLYELLTGSTPVDRKSLKKAALMEVLRMVREEEAPRPSTKLSSSEALPTIAANRHSEPDKLSNLMKGELDWIVMKALEKDRSRRYETANGFAADILHFLAGEPVTAVPPSASYRIRKFINKNRSAVIAASLIALTLLGSLIVSTLGFYQANQQRLRAEGAEQQALGLLHKAETATSQARQAADAEKLAREHEQKQRKYAEAIADFVKKDFLALTTLEGQFRFGDPQNERLDKDATLKQLLDRAAKKLSERKDLDPVIEADLLWMIGVSYRAMNENQQAISNLERCVTLRKKALGESHEKTLLALNSLAVAYTSANKPAPALEILEKLRIEWQKHPGATPDSNTATSTLHNLAIAYVAAGKTTQAIALLEQLRDDVIAKKGLYDSTTLNVLYNLGVSYTKAGMKQEAVAILEKAREGCLKQLGTDHPLTLDTLDSLANAYQNQGRKQEALSVLEKLHPNQVRVLGRDNPKTLVTMNNLASAYWGAKRFDKSIPLLEEVVRLKHEKYGRGHPQTYTSVANLGINYLDSGRVVDAIPLLKEVYVNSRKQAVPHWVGTRLLQAYAKSGDVRNATTLTEEILTQARQSSPKDSPQLARSLAILGSILVQGQMYDVAEPLLRESLVIRQQKEPEDWLTYDTMSLLGGVMLAKKQHAEAAPLLIKGYEGMHLYGKVPVNDPKQFAYTSRLSEALDRLIQFYTETNKPEEVKKWQEEKEKLPKPAEK